MTRTQNNCVFCSSPMAKLSSSQAAEAILTMLISPTSTLYSMAKGATRTQLDGEAFQCPKCWWLAIHPRPANGRY